MRVQGSESWVQSSGFRVQDSGFKVQGLLHTIQGSRCRSSSCAYTIFETILLIRNAVMYIWTTYPGQQQRNRS